MQNIDKIAIALALIINVGGIIWALTGEDKGATSTDAIETARDTIESLQRQQEIRPLSPPAVDSLIREPFQVTELEALPAWAFYRKPASAIIVQPRVVRIPSIEPAHLGAVEVSRDAGMRRAMHSIRGRRARLKNASITGERIEVRREGGEWEECGSVPPGPPGADFEITINGLPVGVKYAYRIRSTAESMGETPFPAGQDEKLSGESDPVLLPPDEVWKATGTNPSAIDAGGNIVPGRSMVIRISWDYAKGKRAIQRGVFTESPRNQKGEDIFGSGWYLDRVVPKGEGKPEHEVLLRRLDGSRERMTLVNNSNPLPLDPSGYSAPEEPEGAEAGAGKPEERAAAEEPEETEPPPDDGAGGLFGDD